MTICPQPCRRRAAAISFDVRVLLLAVSLNLAAPRLLSQAGEEQRHPTTSLVTQSRGQQPNLPDFPREESPPPLTPKQQRELLKVSYEKMKEEADELAGLAKALQDELKKSNHNILSLQIVEKADKIEKLAKKIKSEAVR
jgi:hypothetical protein